MIDVLNLALPYFGLIFIGFACGKSKGLPEQGLAWMNFFLLYVSLPALLFGIMAKTPFAELNNPPFLIASTLGTMIAFVLAMLAGRLIGGLSFREMTLAGLSGGYGNIGYMGPGLALAVLGSRAAAPTALEKPTPCRHTFSSTTVAASNPIAGTFITPTATRTTNSAQQQPAQ